MPADDQRKTARAERIFRGSAIGLMGPDMQADKPVTLEGIAEQIQILGIHLSGVASGLELLAGAIRDVYEQGQRIEAKQASGKLPHSPVGIGTRFPSIP